MGSWLVAGVAIVAWLAWWRRLTQGACSADFDTAFAREARILTPLLLRPALTLLALVSVALRPVLSLRLHAAGGAHAGLGDRPGRRWRSRRSSRCACPHRAFRRRAAGEVFLLSFLAYAALVPPWAWHWDSHPGNEPKTLRQAVALGHWLTFDAEAVTGPMEQLETRPLAASLAAAAATLSAASRGGCSAPSPAARPAGTRSRATRISRQVVRGKDGGVYSVLAPGPSLLLAPALRADRALNRARGEAGRVAVSVLLFCALGAWLVAAVFLLVRDATGRAGLAAALAFGFALVPPFLFYFYQFYPEMLGRARAGARVPHASRCGRSRSGCTPGASAALLAALPWLHQKFLPVWGVLLATALLRGLAKPGRESAGPLAAGSGPRACWCRISRACTCSPSTTSPSRAACGRTRCSSPGARAASRARASDRALLGLLLDARFGILPYVPLLLLAGGRARARRRAALRA